MENFGQSAKEGLACKNMPIKRSFLANNLNQTADRKPKVTNSPMATKTTLTYLLLMNSFSFWQLENAKVKCRIEKINKFALDSLQTKIAALSVLRNIRHAA